PTCRGWRTCKSPRTASSSGCCWAGRGAVAIRLKANGVGARRAALKALAGAAGLAVLVGTGAPPAAGAAHSHAAPGHYPVSRGLTIAGNAGIGTVSPVSRLTVDADFVRNRSMNATRYRSDWSVASGGANLNAFDDGSPGYLPLTVDGASVALRAGGSPTTGLT